jgi:hypothetical protein
MFRMIFNIRMSRFSIVCITFIFFFVSLNTNAQNIDRRLQLYLKIDKEVGGKYPTIERAKILEKKYYEIFESNMQHKRLKRTNSKDLNALFYATEHVLFYTLEAKYISDLKYIVEILSNRGKVSYSQLSSLFKSYVSLRMFREAANLKSLHPDLNTENLPELKEFEIKTKSGKTELAISISENILERRIVEFGVGPQIFIVSHPVCHFSQNALVDIFNDVEITQAINGYVKLIAPQDRTLGLETFRKWNVEHQSTPMTIVYNRSEWPEIDSWSTPTFYFFNEGILISKFSGWPLEGNKEKLISSLREIGLLTH